MFILLRGASKEDAFRIGKEITDHITKINPPPVQLKFEKVGDLCNAIIYELIACCLSIIVAVVDVA